MRLNPCFRRSAPWRAGLLAILLAATAGCAALHAPPAPEPSAAPRPPAATPALGPADARATLTVLYDVRCLHCAKEVPVLAGLRKSYPEDLRIVFMPMMRGLPTSREAAWGHPSHRGAAASLAAHRQERFLEYTRVLFDNPYHLGEDDLRRYADELGLDLARFDRDRASAAVRDAVDANRAEYVRLGLNFTPAIFLNGERLEHSRPRVYYAEQIDAALGRAGAAPQADAEPASHDVLWGAMIYPVGELAPRLAETHLSAGDEAPDFRLPSIDGGAYSLSGFRGRKHVVLSFVPAAFTPVCSGQWPEYAARMEEIEALDAVLLGVTTDNVPTLYAWTRGMPGLEFPVLSDFWPHGAAARAYGVLREDSGVAERAVFVVDKQGVIRYVEVHDINSAPAMEDFLEVLRALQN